MKTAAEKISALSGYRLIERGLFAALIIISLSLLFLSLHYRLPLAREAGSIVLQVYNFENVVERYAAGWSAEEAKSIHTKGISDYETFISSYEQLAGWLELVRARAKLAGFNMVFTVGKPQPSPDPIEGLKVVYIDMKLTPIPNNKNRGGSDYLKMIDFVKYLSEQDIRVDMMENSFWGDGKLFLGADFKLRHWITFNDIEE